jgi:hypothetical protein
LIWSYHALDDRKSFARQVLFTGYRLGIDKEQWDMKDYEYLFEITIAERVRAFRISTTNAKRQFIHGKGNFCKCQPSPRGRKATSIIKAK